MRGAGEDDKALASLDALRDDVVAATIERIFIDATIVRAGLLFATMKLLGTGTVPAARAVVATEAGGRVSPQNA